MKMKAKLILPITLFGTSLSLVLICNVFANPVPDTGQTKCYDNIEEIPCPQPGEPFYGQDGNYSINPQSFTKLDANGNVLPNDAPWPWVMVRDNVTCMMWEVKSEEGSIHDKDNKYYLFNIQDVFFDALNEVNFGGYSDWRMPTIKELHGIVDSSISEPGPTINTYYFPNTEPSYYWTSTKYLNSDYSNCAWDINFMFGLVSWNTFGWFHARAVRAGYCGSFGNYIDNVDGTVSDASTGLMWQKDTAPSVYTWQQALSYCDNLSLADSNDWRLPNINELQSLVNYDTVSPSINTSYFPNTEPFNYWTSTSSASSPGGARTIYFDTGYLGGGNKSNDNNYVRCVRDECLDTDADGICDAGDNCPHDYNPNQEDIDVDCTGDACDNCIENSNPIQEDADGDQMGDVCDDCTDIDDDGYGNQGFLVNTCAEDNCPNTPNPNQEDSYPPQGNGIGDACECEGDFDCDGDCDGTDAVKFKQDFGRNPLNSPCYTCNGDFSCDGDVDGSDAGLFKQDFGRSSFNSPCPVCVAGDWCGYENCMAECDIALDMCITDCETLPPDSQYICLDNCIFDYNSNCIPACIPEWELFL